MNSTGDNSVHWQPCIHLLSTPEKKGRFLFITGKRPCPDLRLDWIQTPSSGFYSKPAYIESWTRFTFSLTRLLADSDRLFMNEKGWFITNNQSSSFTPKNLRRRLASGSPSPFCLRISMAFSTISPAFFLSFFWPSCSLAYTLPNAS